MSDFRISAEARHLPEESDAQSSRYVFSYEVTIRNEGGEPAQLMARHWWVTDGNGAVQEVHGSGVVGKSPISRVARSSATRALPCSKHRWVRCTGIMSSSPIPAGPSRLPYRHSA